MKLRLIGTAKFEGGRIHLRLPRRGENHWYRTEAGLDVWDTQKAEPVTEGGSSTERNIQLLCSVCNKKKSNKI
jgi:5-methylcytosine-specific restriction endonuclease McrA